MRLATATITTQAIISVLTAPIMESTLNLGHTRINNHSSSSSTVPMITLLDNAKEVVRLMLPIDMNAEDLIVLTLEVFLLMRGERETIQRNGTAAMKIAIVVGPGANRQNARSILLVNVQAPAHTLVHLRREKRKGNQFRPNLLVLTDLIGKNLSKLMDVTNHCRETGALQALEMDQKYKEHQVMID